jgi:hypothetical protein
VKYGLKSARSKDLNKGFKYFKTVSMRLEKIKGINPNVMVVKQAMPGNAFDVDQPLSNAQAAEFVKAGFKACVRYFPLNASDVAGCLTSLELQALLSAGLAVMVVQHVDAFPWSPTASLGTSHGSYAVSYAKAIGYPIGGPIYCDMESPATSATAADCLAYINAWVKEVETAGFESGLYCGWGLPLTPMQLFDISLVTLYWRAYNGPEVAIRGYSMIQHTEQSLNGIPYDPNTIQADDLGDLPIWVANS